MNHVNLIFDVAIICFEMKDVVVDAVEEAEDGYTSLLVCCTSFASFEDWVDILVDNFDLERKWSYLEVKQDS